jgi:hypothetical protein
MRSMHAFCRSAELAIGAGDGSRARELRVRDTACLLSVSLLNFSIDPKAWSGERVVPDSG